MTTDLSAVVDSDEKSVLTSRQLRSRRARNVAIAIAVALMALLVYALTIAKLGSHVADRTL